MKKKEYKSVSISKDVYNIIKNKQQELIAKNDNDYVELSYVAEKMILAGVNVVTFDEVE